MSLHWEIPQGDLLHIAEEQSNLLRAEVIPLITFNVSPMELAADVDLQ